MDSAPGIPEVLGNWSLNLPWIAIIAATAFLYFRAVRKAWATPVRVPHPRWKAWAFGLGLALLAIGVLSPIEHYGNQVLFADFLGFLFITMLAPPLLVLGSPLTLAFRVTGPVGRRRLRRFYRSGAMYILTFPVCSGLLFAFVTYLWQFSALTDIAARNEVMRFVQQFSLVIVSLLFWTPAMCADPVRWRVPHPLRALYVFVEMTHKALFGAMFLAMSRPVHTEMVSRMPAWAPGGLLDQRMAIVILWIGGNMVFLAVTGGIIVKWVAYEARNTARIDKRLEKERAEAKSKKAALEKVFERGV
jgi:putative copper resistance protein D